jgi:hypothetical protein
MANRFRKDVENALKHLEDPEILKKELTWHRNGPRGSLHPRSSCYKSNTWGSETVKFTIEQASRKRVCSYCCELDNLIPATASHAVSKVGSAALSLEYAERELAKAGTGDIGLAISYVDRAEDFLTNLKEDEADLVGPSLKAVKEKLRALRTSTVTAAVTLRENAIVWATSAISRRVVLRDETNVLGVEGNDFVVFGPNQSEKNGIEHLLPRIYLRWNRLRQQGKQDADAAAIALLDEAVLHDPKQLDFHVEAPTGDVTLLTWSVQAWRDELRTRLTGRLIPLWETNFTQLLSRTGTKLVGIYGDISKDETRSLLAAHPGAQRGRIRLALVPQVVADWIQMTEKRWSSDTVEIVDACEPDLLETVAALWEPHTRDSEFLSLETALRAASAV